MCAVAVAATAEHRPHDLLWVDAAAALIAVDVLPVWATVEWLSVAPVVVRRAPITASGAVPVGLRGATRSERCAAHVAADRIVRVMTPEAIARRVASHPLVRSSPLPCLRALARIAPGLDRSALAWGVTGSVGFTLASGFDVLRESSDLDLLVRAPDRRDGESLRAVAAVLRDACSSDEVRADRQADVRPDRPIDMQADVRIDVQVETPRGAFALKEWLRTGGAVLLKTAAGPLLCDDPW